MAVAFSGWRISKQLNNKSLSLYSTDFKVHHRVLHYDGQPSKLVVQAQTKAYRISIKAYPTFKAHNLIFDKTYTVESKFGEVKSFEIDINEPVYWIAIEVVNLNNNNFYSDVIIVDQLHDNNQSIHVMTPNRVPILKEYVDKYQKIYLTHRLPTVDTFYIKYYNEVHKPAPPPFSTKGLQFNPKSRSDTTFIITSGQLFEIHRQGLYFIQANQKSRDGVYLNCFDEDFPRLAHSDDLVKSIRYITKDKEYKKLRNARSKKLALDDFWLEIGGTKAHAKSLLRAYYNRIQTTNEYFSTYKEGWKTDRGVVYTIFGPPQRIQKNHRHEYWFYRFPERGESIDIYFQKIDGQFILRRTNDLEPYWNMRIYEWRNGIIN